MTTDETSTTDATQPEEKPKKRSLSELMALKTYQGMTDEEIQSIIDFLRHVNLLIAQSPMYGFLEIAKWFMTKTVGLFHRVNRFSLSPTMKT